MIALLIAAALVYAGAVFRLRRRGVDWPPGRALAWYLGIAAAVAVPGHAHTFRDHMIGHLVLGMGAPLLLVLARPVTLALRALPVRAARRLARALRSRPVVVLTHPVTAGVLDAGGLVVLYTTGLHSGGFLVGLHLLLTGYLFTAAAVGRDPAPHRPGPAVRSAVLIAFIAVHGILAKHLYGHPPPGVPAAEAEQAAQLMYYGGDLLHLAVIVLLCRELFPSPTRAWRLPPSPAPAACHNSPVTAKSSA
ncbi:cytochrome c oxidase assembly protein [Paractinoplanes brasiliensis]|uniref:Putative membrane protein n=1 Tax=Paractinoplanes brasiliensis TaxID=52695 RepID=A0A4R6JTK6_9ACTN|nr:cytochrome c oxidase assembly protein [Actinoplanes brasiliensis]TDO38346.1 putative membrane protein [Actinoplanes brasiliensis]GID26877.1 membrane protein [Actinoplanes brasiliensis]